MSDVRSVEQFSSLLSKTTEAIGTSALDEALARRLNQQFPANGEDFKDIFAACRHAIEAGWMCQRTAGGIRYGRVIKPGGALGRFSVDVVEMQDVVGPVHAHPNGEIDLVMPIDSNARFDGNGAGWVVYSPGSRHAPTVTAGKALVLYLLPEGAIDFNAAATP